MSIERSIAKALTAEAKPEKALISRFYIFTTDIYSLTGSFSSLVIVLSLSSYDLPQIEAESIFEYASSNAVVTTGSPINFSPFIDSLVGMVTHGFWLCDAYRVYQKLNA